MSINPDNLLLYIILPVSYLHALTLQTQEGEAISEEEKGNSKCPLLSGIR